MKFKVGDKVRINSNSSFVGRVGEVTEVDEYDAELPYEVTLLPTNSRAETLVWFGDEELELVSGENE